MNQTTDSLILSRREQCAVCGASLANVIDLPSLPITDSYCREPVENPIPNIDQKFLLCESCSHGQIETIVDPATLYGSNYCFRTAESATARKGTDFFLSVLNGIEPTRKFNCVLDFGCSDLYLLTQLKERAKHRIGIDPVWQGREDQREDKSIQVFGQLFEDVDFSQFPAKPDLIVCRHTLEHIVDPEMVVRTLLEIAADDALLVFEVPGFDGLIQRLRFDQVFHQHMQYFSLASFLKLIEITNGHYVTNQFNYHDWGAMAVAFTKNASPLNNQVPKVKQWTLNELDVRYQLFQQQMNSACSLLSLYKDSPLYGYGAAQMLPVLGYHMGTDFSELIAVLDDDPNKDGMGYWNLPVRIMTSDKAKNWADSTVMVTAIDNVKPIMTKLLANRPKHIIHPLNII